MLENNKKHQELDLNSMVNGIGRKATDEELTDYLKKDLNEEPIDLDKIISMYNINRTDQSSVK